MLFPKLWALTCALWEMYVQVNAYMNEAESVSIKQLWCSLSLFVCFLQLIVSRICGIRSYPWHPFIGRSVCSSSSEDLLLYYIRLPSSLSAFHCCRARHQRLERLWLYPLTTVYNLDFSLVHLTYLALKFTPVRIQEAVFQSSREKLEKENRWQWARERLALEQVRGRKWEEKSG